MGDLLKLLLESFPKIILPGLTITLPLTAISFTFALVIAVLVALVQYASTDLQILHLGDARYAASDPVVSRIFRTAFCRDPDRSHPGGDPGIFAE